MCAILTKLKIKNLPPLPSFFVNLTARTVLTILLGVALVMWASCKSTKGTTRNGKDKRIYTVWASPPETVLVVTMQQDSTLEFYFNRDEWFRSAAGTISDNSSLGTYRVLIDSLEKHDGLIQFEKLLRIDEKQPNLSRTTQKIFDSPLIAGHV